MRMGLVELELPYWNMRRKFDLENDRTMRQKKTEF